VSSSKILLINQKQGVKIMNDCEYIKDFWTNDDVRIVYSTDFLKQDKENDFKKAIENLYEYMVNGDFETEFDFDVENDYCILCEEYPELETYNILHRMGDLDSYCEEFNITISNFLENMDDSFSLCDNYFCDSRQYISGDSLTSFNIDYLDIVRQIAFSPEKLLQFENGKNIILKNLDCDHLKKILIDILNCIEK
jgi:hypothetical protein